MAFHFFAHPARALAASLVIGAAAALVLVGTPALAQEAKSERIMAMESVAQNMRALGQFARTGDAPGDAQRAQAAEVAAVAQRLPALFEARNPGENGNRAKPEIWDDWDGFSKQITQFQSATAQLVAAAESGDASAFGPAFQAVGGSCGACHRPYRAPK